MISFMFDHNILGKASAAAIKRKRYEMYDFCIFDGVHMEKGACGKHDVRNKPLTKRLAHIFELAFSALANLALADLALTSSVSAIIALTN